MVPEGLAQDRRAQQTADMVGAEWRTAGRSEGHGVSPETRPASAAIFYRSIDEI
jgi:hypothetical protein